MKFFWPIIFFVLPLAGVTYSLLRVWTLLPLGTLGRSAVVGVLLLCFLTMFFNFFGGLDRLPMTWAEVCYEVGYSSIFILLYVVLLFLLLDFGRLVHLVPPSLLRHSWVGTGLVAAILFVIFLYGNLHYGRKYRQPVTLETPGKKVARPLKIIMLSDLHLGYHNRAAEFGRWVDLINAEHPDLVLVAGDIVDGSIRAIRQQDMAAVFRRIQAPVYACLGNHEYYAGREASVAFYREAGIHLLVDSTATVAGVNIVGRDDRTNRRRKTLDELMRGLDLTRYTILLDHQPYHLEEAERCGVDFQLSGHTHYGQVWPISWIEDAIYEDAYGPLRKGNTHYFVTSGMGIWGGKFRIGTRSEYLVATLR